MLKEPRGRGCWRESHLVGGFKVSVGCSPRIQLLILARGVSGASWLRITQQMALGRQAGCVVLSKV